MEIILAGALGVVYIAVALQFQRLAQVSWQITRITAERDSERIARMIACDEHRPQRRTGPPQVGPAPSRKVMRRKGGLLAGAAAALVLGAVAWGWRRR